MAQQDSPQGAPAADPNHKTPGRIRLPDTRGALPIPDHFRLPFKGKEATPTSAPSGTQRRVNLERLRVRARRRMYLGGLLGGLVLIPLLSVFGDLWLRDHPTDPPLRAASLVFLGVCALTALALPAAGVYLAVAKSRAATGKATSGSFSQALRTVLFLSLAALLFTATAWFMIPGGEWTSTMTFVRTIAAGGR